MGNIFCGQKSGKEPAYGAPVNHNQVEPTRASRDPSSRQSPSKLLIKRRKVAICSRDGEDNYHWLQELLKTRRFGESVKNCHPVYISNNSSEFRQEVLRYDVAILYHTKNRGRINIINVTDSLYDGELKFLHDRLGVKNVIVLIDDLERSDEGEKRKIIEAQKDLGRLAGEVLLFTQQDKHLIKDGRSEDAEVERKLKTLKTKIKKAKKRKRKGGRAR